MAKKKKDKEHGKPSYSDYPIKTLFRVAILGGLVAFLLYYLNNQGDIFAAFFKAFLISVSLAIFGGAVMIVVFYIVSGVRKREIEAAAREQQTNDGLTIPPLHRQQPEQTPPA
ncbi:hypothetical protein MASR2M18_06720 [Ignavibacteria bacterium]|nr:hypothetical protein [Bacteroidota bacterium]MCZ2131689.1 hypothetical protein [Bacteroidota bacterium]